MSSLTATVGCHSGGTISRLDIPSWISVDDEGRLWTAHNRGGYPGNPRRAEVNGPRGYLTVRLSNRVAYAHRVVYAWFHGEVPERLLVRHLNGDRHDNRPENLALGDNAVNMADAVAAGSFTGDHARGVLNVNAKLTEADVKALRRAYAGGVTQVQLARRFGIRQQNISQIVRGKTWVHVA